jgi:hypothetical protein
MLTTIRIALDRGGVRTAGAKNVSAARDGSKKRRDTCGTRAALLTEASTPMCECPKRAMLRYVDA